MRPVRRFVYGAELLLTSIAEWTSGEVLAQAREEGEEVYEPVVTLVGGNLPTSQGLAGKAVEGLPAAWWSPGRLRFTTRHASQAATAAALALVVGEMVAPDRAYWAAVAAFVTFSGASTTSETTRKAIDRIFGTLLGLLASVAIAQVVGDHRPVAIMLMVVGIFLTFYVQALSTTWMICFLTIVLGQLYEVLRTFSDQLLVLRLTETAIGGAAGILVTYVVLPAPARDTIIVARRVLLTQLADLLDHTARVLDGGSAGSAPAGSAPAGSGAAASGTAGPAERAALYREVVAMDESARQLALGHDSMIRPRLFDADHAGRSCRRRCPRTPVTPRPPHPYAASSPPRPAASRTSPTCGTSARPGRIVPASRHRSAR